MGKRAQWGVCGGGYWKSCRDKRVNFSKRRFKQTKYIEKMELWVMHLNQSNDYAHSILSGLSEKNI